MSDDERPAWLPAVVPFSGNWDAFIRTLYAIFEADFKRGAPRFRSRPVWFNNFVETDDSYRFEEGFWHLVTRDQWVWNPKTRQKEKERLPEFDRAGRVPWARPIIEHAQDAAVLVWDSEEPSKKGGIVIRTYLWLEPHQYVVVLQRKERERGDVFNLVTSFFVDSHKSSDLRSRYDRRCK